jgi:hypothetical protein
VNLGLLLRAQAYRVCFLQAGDKRPLEGFLARLRHWLSPLAGPPNPPGAIVLAHLARFCRANKPTSVYLDDGSVDPIASARMDGRREVWLLINEHLHLDDAVVLNLKEEMPQ